MRDYLELLQRRRQFRLLWIGQLISLMGDWFNTIATVILVNRYTDSSLAVGGLFLARSLPFALCGPLAGVIADRFDRKWVIIWSNLLRVPVVLGYLLVTDSETVWLVYACSILQFSLSSFFEPAFAAFLPSLVDRHELVTANALSSVIWSAMLAIGAAIGGAVASLLGVQAALLVDAATFAVAAALVVPIKPEFRPSLSQEISFSGNRFTEFVDGLRYIRGNLGIALLTLVKSLGQIGSVDVMVAVYAERVFVVGENGATTLGILFAATGVGAVTGPLLAGWLTDGSERSLTHWITIGFVQIVLGWLLLGLAPSLAVAALGLLLRGMGGSINWTYSSVLLQMKVPDQFLGRVFGLDFTIFMLTLSLMVWLSGLILDQTSITPRALGVYIGLASIIPLSLWLGALRWQRERQARRQAAAVE